MTPGARAAAAIELLDAVATDLSQPADRLVTAWFRRRRYAGSGDRSVIASLVFTVLRRRAQLDWWLERAGCEASSRSRVMTALIRGFGWSAQQAADSFDGGRYRPAALDAAEHRALDRLIGDGFDHPDQPLHVRGNIPAWMEVPLRVALGGRVEAELAALLREAPVDLRVNTLKGTRGEAIAQLAASGIEAVPSPLSPWGLRLNGRAPLGGTSALRNGLVEPQDEGSQLVCLLAEAQPGESIVDFCAGAGGKTLALAAAMSNEGRLFAVDISEARLDRARRRFDRAGITIAESRVVGADGTLWSGAEEAAFDRVLVDAPCSGTGTWRRSPESRWRLSETVVSDLIRRQAGILDSAARLVAPGGRLAYAVCSLLAEEGEGQIVGFLRRRPDFEVIPASRVWRRVLGAEYPCGDTYLRLLPGRDGTDGFFVALLRRVRINK